MGRSPRCSKDGLNKGAWTAVEDEILINYVKSKGEGKWSNLAKETGLKRCGKSCRLRWMNYLRPDIKRGNISGDEEELIIRLHKLLGNRWSLIAGRLPGRTDNEIKNYWNSYLAKKAKDSLPVARSNIDKNPVTGLRNEARNDQANVTPQQHMEDQNHDSKVATRPSTDTYQVTTEKSKLPSESSAGLPSSTSREDINSSDFILDLSSEDLCKMLDSDFAKLGDVDMNELNNAMEGDGGPLLLSEGMEKSLGSSECGQPTNLVSDFRPLFLESDDAGWLGDDIDVLFSD